MREAWEGMCCGPEAVARVAVVVVVLVEEEVGRER